MVDQQSTVAEAAPKAGKIPPLLERMRRAPQSDWTIKDVETMCLQTGLVCTAPTRGDHYKVSSPYGGPILMVPATRPIKTVYIRKLVKVADSALRASQERSRP